MLATLWGTGIFIDKKTEVQINLSRDKKVVCDKAEVWIQADLTQESTYTPHSAPPCNLSD